MVKRRTTPKATQKIGRTPKRARTSARPQARQSEPLPIEAPTPQEILAAARVSLSSQLQHLWKETPTQRALFDGVTVHQALMPLPVPHWHLVTEGLAGVGFELTLRVPGESGERAPMPWALELMGHLIASGRAGQLARANGQTITLARPLGGSASTMQSVALGPDSLLKPLATPGGAVPVWVIFGLTPDEARITREWNPGGLLEVARAVNALLVTDLERSSLLMSPRARSVIEQRVEREGSAMEGFATRISELKQTERATTWRLGSDAVETVVSLLKGRIAHQRAFQVRAGTQVVEVTPVDAAPSGVSPHVLKLSQTAARQMRATLKSKPGTYTWEALPDFKIEIVS